MRSIFYFVLVGSLLAGFSRDAGAGIVTNKAQPPWVTFKSGSAAVFNSSIMPKLKNISQRLGRKPVMVTSGFRSVSHNKTVGGAKNSAHLTGNAVDIREQSNPYSLASSIYKGGLFSGQVLWNTCRPHVHLGMGRSGHFNECGKAKSGKRKKESKVKGKKKKPKKPVKRQKSRRK